MTASYPNNVKAFTPKVNVVDLIQAADPNSLFEEVTAIESVIGTTPSVATAATASGWANTATDYTTINGRLANIEKGIVADTHTQYVKNAGGSSIVIGSASTVGLAITAASSQSADLMQWKDADGNIVTRVGPDGILYAAGGQVGSGTDFTANLLLGGM
jgi:beta-mannanase